MPCIVAYNIKLRMVCFLKLEVRVLIYQGLKKFITAFMQNFIVADDLCYSPRSLYRGGKILCMLMLNQKVLLQKANE